MFRKLPILLIIACTFPASAQDNRFLDLDDWRYTHIQRLQERGHLLELNPTDLPYIYQEVIDAVAAADTSAMSVIEKRWLSLIADRQKTDVPEHHVRLFGEAGGGVRVINSERLDPLRQIGTDLEVYQRLYVKAGASRGRWVGHVGLVHDGYYERDPDGIDTALRAQSRAEDGYLGYNSDPVNIYLGRFANNWGTYGSPALIVSDNPRAFDQINLRFGGSKFSFRSFFAELDAITGDGRFTGTAGADSVRSGLERRFLFGHRFDIRPNRNLTLTIIESVLLSGPGTGLSLRFLNPFTAVGLENDNAPKNDENNAVLGLMLWARVGSATVHSQVMMDDLDVLNLGSERTSVAATTAIVYTPPRQSFDVRLAATGVAARTYNTNQTEGQYVYLLRGLGTQFNDFIHASAGVQWYADAIAPGLILKPTIQLLKQGEQRITGDFPGLDPEVDTILSGVVETTRRASLGVEYQRYNYWWLGADLGANSIDNELHIEGQTETRFSGSVSFGLRIPIQGSDQLDL